MHSPHQRSHILPSPGGKVCRTGRRKLRRIDGRFRRRVKVIVKMDAVHGVVLQKLRYPLHHIICSGRLCRVQVQPLPHRAHPLRMGVGKVIGRKVRRHRGRGAQPVGVQPRLH